MITLRKAAERGRGSHGWLESRHTFSFAGYHDPAHMGISNLRVINDDRVAPAKSFATHGHRDMEIVSYVLEGALAHRDSMGNGSVIRPGDVQRMSAGSGVTHSEYNASDVEPVRFLQIWLLPNRRGIAPGYAQRHFDRAERSGRLRLLVSPDGRDDSLSSSQDADLYGALLDAGETVRFTAARGGPVYVHVATGEVELDGARLAEGDGATLEGASTLEITGIAAADVLLFDLP